MKAQKFVVGDVVYRHGDVLLKKTDVPNGHESPVVAQAVLHAGLNHNHTITGEFRLFEKDGKKFVEILSKSMLGHDEHGAIEIKARPTALEIVIQQEYDHWSEESRAVID